MRNCLCALVILIIGVGGAVLAAPNAAASPPPGLHVLQAEASGLVLEWVASPVAVQPLADKTLEVTAAGYLQTQQPGEPSLPFTSTLIALPPGAIPRLSLSAIEESTQWLPAPLAVAPRPEGTIQDEAGRPIGGAFVAAEPTGQTIPAPVLLEEIGIARGVRLARLTFYPARPEGERLRIVHRIRVEIRWDTVGRVDNPSHDDPLIAQVKQAVLNPWDAVPTLSTAPAAPRLSLHPTGGGTPTAFVEVSSPGLYRVTYADVKAMGFGWADPHNLHLFQGDREIAYEWEGDEDATFEEGEALAFYAEPRFSRWTAVDAYRLVAGETEGLRMETRSANPTGLPAGTPWVERLFEENRLYTPDRFAGPLPAGRDGDRWAWDYLSRPGHPAETYPFSLTAVNSSRSATLTLWLIGHTGGEHHWNVSINGTPLGSVAWTGRTAITATLAVPPSVLQNGNNTLSVSLPITAGAWLDAFALRHARSTAAAGDSLSFTGETERRAYTVTLTASGPYRVYDVTDPLRPQRLPDAEVNGYTVRVGDPPGGGPHRYLVVAEDSGILCPARVRAREDPWGFRVAGGGFTGAEYLIVTHPDFADALGPLVSLRQSQGITVTVANVLGIYDAYGYGDGRPDPEAIRRFIAAAYATWNPRPADVLLVGDGSFDPRRYRPTSPPTFIPPYLADVDPWAGETAADNRYACVDGDDNLPDLLIGRLPVDSPAEAQAVVQKIVAYETNPLPGGWNTHVVLVADDADSGVNFAASSDAYAASHVTTPFTVTRRYCAGSSSAESDCSSVETAALHTALLGDWNRGALVMQYTGHSSWQQWAAERFFHLDDLVALRNSRRYPIVVEMTCFTGAFQRPEPTLDEQLVTLPDGGAIAAWGPTGLGASSGHNSLADGFFRAVFGDTVTTVGEATLAGKLALDAGGQNLDLLDTFVLLGDPALRFDRDIVPWPAQTFLPLVRR